MGSRPSQCYPTPPAVLPTNSPLVSTPGFLASLMAQTVLEGLYHLYLMAIWWPFETNNVTLSESRFCEVVDFQDGAVLGTMLVETDVQTAHGKSQSLWLSRQFGESSPTSPHHGCKTGPPASGIGMVVYYIFHVNNGERDILFAFPLEYGSILCTYPHI
ncbi:hypothetical protein FA13DRAFT_1715865 [Coprinellus micaceus]|uniref:Uncharacterized protein n=1 Tax=Coprinellus micaceus TaxID=71717 RepID=A0A4Y7SM08_COPMI|nr:hypothetical protein FA13DRAFT_1715865 [Coprinellus micaceus]